MESRSKRLREQHRRVLGWSLGIAVLVHAAVFAFWPAFQVEPLASADTEDDESAGAAAVEGMPVDEEPR